MSTTEPLSVPVRRGPHCNGAHMTPAEFDAVEEWDENYRYELINRVLVVTPPAGLGERSLDDELGKFTPVREMARASGPSAGIRLAERPGYKTRAGPPPTLSRPARE
jgi:hypothetical protein